MIDISVYINGIRNNSQYQAVSINVADAMYQLNHHANLGLDMDNILSEIRTGYYGPDVRAAILSGLVSLLNAAEMDTAEVRNLLSIITTGKYGRNIREPIALVLTLLSAELPMRYFNLQTDTTLETGNIANEAYGSGYRMVFVDDPNGVYVRTANPIWFSEGHLRSRTITIDAKAGLDQLEVERFYWNRQGTDGAPWYQTFLNYRETPFTIEYPQPYLQYDLYGGYYFVFRRSENLESLVPSDITLAEVIISDD